MPSRSLEGSRLRAKAINKPAKSAALASLSPFCLGRFLPDSIFELRGLRSFVPWVFATR
jgi:hypothetical protein